MIQKINSLQALRAIAFIGIFLSHAHAPIAWPALGVSIFFVLSGFLMFCSHCYENPKLSLKNNLAFSLNKIKRLYPLHIITMFFAILLMLANLISYKIAFNYGLLKTTLRDIFLNVTLTQTWFPDSQVNVSLNGVAWYLSVTLFLYFMFPCINKKLRTMRNITLFATSITVLFLQWLLCIPYIKYVGGGSHLYIWFMYCFPIFRLGDFWVGCCLGKYYISTPRHNNNFIVTSIIEIAVLLLTIHIYKFMKISHTSPYMIALQNSTTIYIPLATCWVYLFAKKEGIITTLLSNRILVWLGNISAYAFLIHYVYTQYTNFAIRVFNIRLSNLTSWLLISVELLLTIITCLLYKKWSANKNLDCFWFCEKFLSETNN